MAMIAISANAKESVDFSASFTYGSTVTFGSWEWKGKQLSQGDVDNTTGDDSSVTYYNGSSFDYVCIKYKEATVAFSFIIQYNAKGTVGQWGPEFNQSNADITTNTSGLVAIKLDGTQKNTINQVALQSKGDGTIIIEDIYFASEAEYTEDLSNNPITAYVPPTKELTLDSSTNGWGNNTFDKTTGKCTIVGNDAAYGWWVSVSSSDYGKLVIELEDVKKVGYLQVTLSNDNNYSIDDGSYIKVIDISDATDISRVMIQGGAGSEYTIKKVYFATNEYITENNIVSKNTASKINLSLSDLGSGWNSSYDAETKTISITDEAGGGKGWWFGIDAESAADYSDFDNLVIETATTTVGGKVIIEYLAEGSTSSEIEFGVGATCIVVPLDATNKSAVKQIYISGANGAIFTLKDAYVAKASVTPAANIGTIVNAIQGVKAAQQNGVRYNLAGQKVGAGYRGVVIENGRKVVIK